MFRRHDSVGMQPIVSAAHWTLPRQVLASQGLLKISGPCSNALVQLRPVLFGGSDEVRLRLSQMCIPVIARLPSIAIN